MGMSQLGEITEQLIRHGKDPQTPVALIEKGTTADERTVTGTLANITKLAAVMKISNPAMIIIGEVVNIREQVFSLQQHAARYRTG
ncbi:Uroporphyrinogen-III C-methyltransferase [compost metagenome]